MQTDKPNQGSSATSSGVFLSDQDAIAEMRAWLGKSVRENVDLQFGNYDKAEIAQSELTREYIQELKKVSDLCGRLEAGDQAHSSTVDHSGAVALLKAKRREFNEYVGGFLDVPESPSPSTPATELLSQAQAEGPRPQGRLSTVPPFSSAMALKSPPVFNRETQQWAAASAPGRRDHRGGPSSSKPTNRTPEPRRSGRSQ
ncbi:hypothetical protein [Micromonospora sp. SH-82]|uniref:hypothetical protein n=1 Tax=Micromonospora sp. SH-82 TaxID=3132938 RepID=UPI003EBD7157